MAILEAALRNLLDDMGVDTSQARVSVYSHSDDRFFLLARVSGSQGLEARGRSTYLTGQGVIGQAWDLGRSLAARLPADRSAWNRRNEEEWGIPSAVAAQLTMQARSLLGRRLDVPGLQTDPVGVLVVESLQPQGLNGRSVDQIDELPSFPLISQVLVEVVRCLDEEDIASGENEPAQ